MLPFGIAEVDSRLPGGGLALGALHEVAGGGNGAIDGAAAALFAAGIAARTKGKVLWCMTRPDLFAPALAQAGLAPDRVIYVEAGDDRTVLACMEEGLRHGGLGGVVAEVARLSMTASRRLQLAAEGTGTIGIALRRWRRQTEAADFGQPTAAMTRWRVSALPSDAAAGARRRPARWLVELIRAGPAKVRISSWRRAMTRVVSLFLPTWPTDRLRRQAGDAAPPPEAPLVLVGREGSRRVVLAADAAARPRAFASACRPPRRRRWCPASSIQDADPAADAEALERLALWVLQRYRADRRRRSARRPRHRHHRRRPSPRRRAGHARRDLVGRLAMSGIAARAAVADTWGAAHALARYAARPTCRRAARARRLRARALPIAALRLPADVVADLRVLGFERIGELLAQPRAPLALRFGPELGRRLDQALGAPGRADRAGPPAGPDRGRAAPSPSRSAPPRRSPATSASSAMQLCATLEAKGLGARRLDLLFHRVDNRDRRRSASAPPSRCATPGG